MDLVNSLTPHTPVARITADGYSPAIKFSCTAEEWTATSILSYGIDANDAVDVSLPIGYHWLESGGPPSSQSDVAAGNLMILFKRRLVRWDYGPTNTARVSLLGGMEFPTGDPTFASDGWNPLVGAVYTQVHERMGWNVSLQYKFTTGGNPSPLRPGDGRADLFQYDAAYLWRLLPAAYTEQSRAAWYLVAEANGAAETNGDHELLLSPGILYEADDLAVELSIQLPAYRHLAYRPERELSIVLGFRWLF